MTKTLYRCKSCRKYSLNHESCSSCGGVTGHPYPARFSIIKEQKYRAILRRARNKKL